MNRSQSKFHNQHAEQPHAEDWCPGIKRNTEAGAVILNIAFAQDDDGGVGQNEGKHDDGRCDGDQLFQRQQLRGDHDRSGDKKCRQRHFPLSIGIAEEAGNQGVTPHCIGKACRRHYSRVGCSDECHHRTKGDDGKAGSAVILPCGIRKRCQRTCKLSGLQYTDSDNQSQDIDECDGNDRTDHPEGKVAFGIADFFRYTGNIKESPERDEYKCRLRKQIGVVFSRDEQRGKTGRFQFRKTEHDIGSHGGKQQQYHDDLGNGRLPGADQVHQQKQERQDDSA